MRIKYTDNSGKLDIKCPHDVKFDFGFPVTILVGSENCIRCSHYGKSKVQYHMNCRKEKD